ncbi:hypothetical protein ACFL35_03925 [Candidatus Riflebacteria bacterium]
MKRAFPKHGSIECKNCFPDKRSMRKIGDWQVLNEPAAWGSSNPEILILGFSKGATQSGIFKKGKFDDIPFGGQQCRKNLTNILRCVGILDKKESIDNRIKSTEKRFAFGSLVRCSLARYDRKKSAYLTSGVLINKSFSEIPEIIMTCVRRFLSNIPSKTRLILMLGSSNLYIKNCKKVIRSILLDDFQEVNSVSYGNKDILWAHLTHPSPGNGTIKAWLNGEGKPGKKMKEARSIIKTVGLKKRI